jgi:ABC-type branched-subunit amino acid transport system permease subunit
MAAQVLGGYLLIIGERAIILAIAALSLELLIGVAGLISFGHAAFLGIGAYAAGILASRGYSTLILALPAAILSSALFALLTGAIAVRCRFLLGNQVEFVSPAYMHWQRSGELILMVLLGGSGTRYGPIVGAMTYLLAEESLARFTEHWKAILGPLLIVLVLFGRGGIAGVVERWRRGELSLATLWAVALARAVPRLKASAAAFAARWRQCNMRVGEALVSLVLIVDRSIGGAIARWRRR